MCGRCTQYLHTSHRPTPPRPRPCLRPPRLFLPPLATSCSVCPPTLSTSLRLPSPCQPPLSRLRRPPALPLSSSHLISASFDKTVAYHDLSAGTTTRSIDVGSFATSLAPSSLSGGQICYVGTTGKKLLTLDRRAGAIVASWDNDTMVSAVSILRDSSSDAAGGGADEQLLTGDHGGLIRTWSSRMQRHIHSQPNDPHNKPISHLHCLRTSNITPPHRPRDEQLDDDEDDSDQRTLIATNSFDDVLRVYETGRDRAVGKGRSGGGGGVMAANGASAELRLLYELKGVKNQNWPIKSSFYRGKRVARSTAVDGTQRPALLIILRLIVLLLASLLPFLAALSFQRLVGRRPD